MSFFDSFSIIKQTILTLNICASLSFSSTAIALYAQALDVLYGDMEKSMTVDSQKQIKPCSLVCRRFEACAGVANVFPAVL